MKNPKVEFYFANALSKNKWYLEIEKLRTIILELNLQEELKWGCPCYTDNGSNIILIHVFKEYCALLFFKGALHKNADGSLIQQTKNVQSARQMRFTTVQEISKKESSIKANIKEAIAIEKAGIKVEKCLLFQLNKVHGHGLLMPVTWALRDHVLGIERPCAGHWLPTLWA